jgi:hypothetical protein
MLAFQGRGMKIKPGHSEIDLRSLFEQRLFVEQWSALFHADSDPFLQYYI